jgi:plasmid stabilization system protein ParE
MTYRVEVTEPAELEIDRAYLWLSRRSPRDAGRWHRGLLSAMMSLKSMPRRCPIAPDQERCADEVRQLLYTRGRTVYKVLFSVRDPFPDEGEGLVRVLHVWHGAQDPLSADPNVEEI